MTQTKLFGVNIAKTINDAFNQSGGLEQGILTRTTKTRGQSDLSNLAGGFSTTESTTTYTFQGLVMEKEVYQKNTLVTEKVTYLSIMGASLRNTVDGSTTEPQSGDCAVIGQSSFTLGDLKEVDAAKALYIFKATKFDSIPPTLPVHPPTQNTSLQDQIDQIVQAEIAQSPRSSLDTELVFEGTVAQFGGFYHTIGPDVDTTDWSDADRVEIYRVHQDDNIKILDTTVGELRGFTGVSEFTGPFFSTTVHGVKTHIPFASTSVVGVGLPATITLWNQTGYYVGVANNVVQAAKYYRIRIDLQQGFPTTGLNEPYTYEYNSDDLIALPSITVSSNSPNPVLTNTNSLPITIVNSGPSATPADNIELGLGHTAPDSLGNYQLVLGFRESVTLPSQANNSFIIRVNNNQLNLNNTILETYFAIGTGLRPPSYRESLPNRILGSWRVNLGTGFNADFKMYRTSSSTGVVGRGFNRKDVENIVQAEIAKIPPPPNYTTQQTLIFPVADTVLPPTGIDNVVAEIDPTFTTRVRYRGSINSQLIDTGFVVPEEGEHLYEIVFGYTTSSQNGGSASRPGLLVTASQLRAAAAIQLYSPLANPRVHPTGVNIDNGTPGYSPPGSYFRGGVEFESGSGGGKPIFAMGEGRKLLVQKPSSSAPIVTMQVYEWVIQPSSTP